MRGWLVLPFFAMTIAVPVQALGYFKTTWLGPRTPLSYPLPNRIVAFGHGAGYLLISIFGIYAGIALIRLKPNAVRIVKLYFLSRVVFAVSYVFSLSLFLHVKISNPDGAQPDRLIKLFEELIAIALWVGYFNKSKRVAGTYPPSQSTLFR